LKELVFGGRLRDRIEKMLPEDEGLALSAQEIATRLDASLNTTTMALNTLHRFWIAQSRLEEKTRKGSPRRRLWWKQK
jgi:hypothetical protein